MESGGSASTSLNEAVSPRPPLMCTENPDPVKCSGFWGGLKGGGGREKANLMGFGSAATKSHSCTDGNDECPRSTHTCRCKSTHTHTHTAAVVSHSRLVTPPLPLDPAPPPFFSNSQVFLFAATEINQQSAGCRSCPDGVSEMEANVPVSKLLQRR